MPETKSPPTQIANAPVLQETRYDQVSSFMMAAVVGLIVAVLALAAVWLANRRVDRVESVPVEMIEIPGGAEDGAIDETLRVDSPDDVTEDPSLAEVVSEETVLEETLDNVVELSDQASNLTPPSFEPNVESSGNPGRATGNGRRALGNGPGEGGVPRDQRWFVRFADRQTLEEYARQLDYFGIELGALLPDRRIAYVSKISSDSPEVRYSNTGKGETRLYMTWQAGGLKKADVQLLQKAGVDVGAGILFHFYPPETENLLAVKERDYAGRPSDQIRRTYFTVESEGSGYTFTVTRQRYFN